MVTQELLNFIQAQKSKGLNNNAIKGMLLNSGWALEDINQAFPEDHNPLPPPPEPQPIAHSAPPPEATSQAIQSPELTPLSPVARIFIIFLTLVVVIVFALGIAYFGKKYIQSQKTQPSSGGRYSSPLASVL